MKTTYKVDQFKNRDFEGVKSIYDYHRKNGDQKMPLAWEFFAKEIYMYPQNISIAFESDPFGDEKRDHIVGFGVSIVRNDKCELTAAYCINGLEATEEAALIEKLKVKSFVNYKKPPTEAEAQAVLIRNLQKEKEQEKKERTTGRNKTFPDRYRFGSQ